MLPIRSSLVGLLLACLLTTTTRGQETDAPPGSAEAYGRAASLFHRFEDLAFGRPSWVRWLEGGQLWYEVATNRTSTELVVVDPAAEDGQRRRVLATYADLRVALKDALGVSELKGGRVRVERLHWDGGERATLLFADGLGGWTLDLPTGAVRVADLRERTEWHLTALKRAGRSREARGRVGLTFVNATGGPVDLYWVDTRRQRKHTERLEADEAFFQSTRPTHVWVAVDEAGEDVAYFVAEDRTAVAVIGGAEPVERIRIPPRATPEELAAAGNGTLRGRFRAHQKDHDVWLTDAAFGTKLRVTDDGSEENPYEGRMYWSPDGRFLLVTQVEQGEDRTVHFVESTPEDQLQPKLHAFSYRKPGDRIDHPRLRLFRVDEEGQTERVPLSDALFPTPWRLTEIAWEEDSSRFTFLYDQRGHQVVRWLAVEAETGAVTTLIDESPTTFVDYSQKRFFHRLEGTDEVLWASERSGWNHLDLIDAKTGTVVRELTRGEWVVREVVDVDEEARTVTLRVLGIDPDQDPYHVHYARVDLDTGALTRLTDADGTHRVQFSPDGTHYVASWSRVDHPRVTELRRTSDGSLVETLEREDWTRLLDAGWKPPRRFVAKGRDGATDIWGVAYYPTNHDPTAKYPIVEQIYAGPHGAHVPKSFRVHRKQQELAELGFVVVQIDGMGTNWRSKAFHDVCWQDIGDAGFPDRIAWIRALGAEDPSLDLERVGIYGGSAGGQNAMRALIAHHDFYSVAIADCGCHDNRMDKIWWNEAWMGWPIGPHYAESSNVDQAHRMEGHLLLIVGEKDRNVDPASTMQVVDALIRADKDFDLLVVPGGGHGIAERSYGTRRRRDFLVRHLLGVEPRWE